MDTYTLICELLQHQMKSGSPPDFTSMDMCVDDHWDEALDAPHFEDDAWAELRERGGALADELRARTGQRAIPLPPSFLAFLSELGAFSAENLLGSPIKLWLEWLPGLTDQLGTTRTSLKGHVGLELVDNPGDVPGTSFVALDAHRDERGEPLWVLVGHDLYPDQVAPLGYGFDRVVLATLLGVGDLLLAPDAKASKLLARARKLEPHHQALVRDVVELIASIEPFSSPALRDRIALIRAAR